MRRLGIAAVFLLAAISSAMALGIFSADSILNVESIQVLNNTTAIVVSTSPATLYTVELFNNSTESGVGEAL
jgi:hypothetical protein